MKGIEERIAKLIANELAVDSVVDVFLPKWETMLPEIKQDSETLYSHIQQCMRAKVIRLLYQLK